MSVNQYRSVFEAVEDLMSRGFATEFVATEKFLQAQNTGKSYSPGQIQIVEHHRFEGESDPDETSVVYAVVTTDETRGVVVDAYGTYASPAIGELLRGAAVADEI